MNNQQMIGKVAALLDPVTPPPHLRHDVVAAISAEGNGRASRTWRWRLGTVGTAAAAGALALLVGQVVGSSEAPPAATAQAAEILHRAADAARADPAPAPRAEQFILTEARNFFPVGPDELGSRVTRTWMSVDGTRDSVIWTSNPMPGERQRTVLPGCRDGRAPQWAPDGSLDHTATRPCTPQPAYLWHLPTDATAMLEHLRRMSDGANPSDEELFGNVGTLIRQGWLPAPSRAALYDAATRIPGVVAVPEMTDTAGRHGVAVALDGNLSRYTLIFHPQSYQFLGWQVEPVEPRSGQPRRKDTVLRIVVVDTAEQMP